MAKTSLILLSSFFILLSGAPAQAAEPDIALSATRAFAQHCYEPNRLGGRSLEPAVTSAWQQMPDELRSSFGLPDDPAVRAWIQPGPGPEDVMLLQMHEQRLGKAGVHSGQLRISCRVTVVSAGLQPDPLQAGLVDLLGSPEGSTRKDVLRNLGYPTPDGWDQACWTILTRIENTDWEPYEHQGRPTCVYLTAPENYAVSQYVVVRLLTRNSGGTAILEFDRTLRPAALAD